MKRCPQCRRDYFDDSLLYCLDDGRALLEGPATADEPETAIFDSLHSRDGVTSAHVYATDRTAVLPTGSSDQIAIPQGSGRKWLAIPLVVAFIALAGYFGFRYLKPAGTQQINSIAVLPFENRSGNADTDYLSDGIAESLIFRLSQLSDLKVSPVSSVVRYKGKEFDAKKISDELGVGAVMTGRLTQRGEDLTISVELIDAANNKIIWGEQYDRKMADLLATQREIASAITQKLQLKLVGNDKGVTKKYTDNNEAYQLYLKGRFHFARRTKVDMERSIELFTHATQLDPSFALAYVGIAESYTSMPSYPYMSPKDASGPAHAAIAKALALDPELPEAHTVAAMIAATDDWDYSTADREFKKAIELGPNLPITHYRYGWTYLTTVGRHDEAIAEMKRAMELEPLSVQQGSNYAAVLIYARRFDEAIEQGRKTYELDPTHVGPQNWLCHSLNAKGLYADAIAFGEKIAVNHAAGVTSLYGCLAFAYARAGQPEKALAELARVKDAAKSRYVANYWNAVIYAGLNDKNNAFSELETAFENRDWFLPRMKVDPYMDSLRSDPRFNAMVKRLNLPE